MKLSLILLIFMGLSIFAGMSSFAYPEHRYDVLQDFCRTQGIQSEGCSFELLRPLEWRYRYTYPQGQVGECRYLCAEPYQYCQGLYKNTPVGYLCGAQ